MSTNQYVKVNISALKVYGGGIDFDLFLKLTNSKVIKIGNQGEDKTVLLAKYELKGITSLLLSREHYDDFVKRAMNDLETHVNSTSENKEQKLEEQREDLKRLDAAQAILRSLFELECIDESSMGLAKNVTKGALKIIGQGHTMKNLQDFKKNCSQEFMRAVITSHVSCCMIDFFPWSSPSSKEKVVLGSILCDITLTGEMFKKLRAHKGTPEELPKEIFNHPFTVLKLLSQRPGFVESDTLIMIEQHHELPDGKGFPKGLSFNRINPLPSIFIVANYFVEKLMSAEFSAEHQEERIINTLSVIPSKFYQGHFKKAADALEKVFNS